MEFKDRLKQYRQDNDLTQDELAKKLFVSRQAVSKYETGRGYPSMDVMTGLSELMGVSLDELISKEELAKQTIYTGQEIRKNKRNTLIAIGLIIVVIIISSIAICLSCKSLKRIADLDNGVTSYDYEPVGLIGTTQSIEPDLDQLKNDKLFGYCCLYDETKDMMIGSSYNINGIFTQVSEQACYYDMDLLISERQKNVRLYEVYYDRESKEYVFVPCCDMDLSLSDKFEIELARDGFLQRYVLRFTTVDTLSEMKIFEYGLDNTLIQSVDFAEQQEYTISPDCLYLVIEEKFEDSLGQTYYNRTAIFNSEINKHYYYPLKILNGNGFGDRMLIINKY